MRKDIKQKNTRKNHFLRKASSSRAGIKPSPHGLVEFYAWRRQPHATKHHIQILIWWYPWNSTVLCIQLCYIYQSIYQNKNPLDYGNYGTNFLMDFRRTVHFFSHLRKSPLWYWKLLFYVIFCAPIREEKWNESFSRINFWNSTKEQKIKKCLWIILYFSSLRKFLERNIYGFLKNKRPWNVPKLPSEIATFSHAFLFS